MLLEEKLFKEKEVSLDRLGVKIGFYLHFLFYPSLFLFPIEHSPSLIFLTIGYSFVRFFGFIFSKGNRNLKPILYSSSIYLIVLLHYYFYSLDFNVIYRENLFSNNGYYIVFCLVIIMQATRLDKNSIIISSLSSFLVFLIFYFINLHFYNLKILWNEVIFNFIIFSASGFIAFLVYDSRKNAVISYIQLFKEKISLQKDIKLARNVQECLFPANRKLNRLRFEVFRKTHKHIGGDFYDFIQLREGNVGIFLTDVAGHGISSAMVAAILKVMVSNMPYILKLTPDRFLTYLDDKLYSDFNSYHATAIYMFLNFHENEILIANAGHPYILYCPKEGEFREIKTLGTLLGFKIREPVADCFQFALNSGDRFFLYTDGIIECMNNKEEQLGAEGLLKILNAYNHLSLAEIKRNVLLDVLSFQGNSDFTDDAMFLIFEIE